MRTAPHVVVVGGGLAGLAAALAVVRGGGRVTLVERRPFLGGRAYSFTDAATGDVLDNGPHAFMGAYTELRSFLADAGAAEAIAFQPRLCVPMLDRRLGAGSVAAPAVPGPLQGLAALLGYRLLSRRDRVRLLAGATRLAVGSARSLAGRTVAEVLAGQSAAARRAFWDPLAIATLNETPMRAAAAPFAAVLRRGFLAGASAARFGVARGPLGDACVAPACGAIEAAGGVVRTGTAIASIELEDGRATAVVVRDGWRIAADAVVLALPVSAMLRLLPPVLAATSPFRALAGLETSPIVSVHLWVDRAVAVGNAAAGAPFVGLLDARPQWLFDTGPSRAGGARLATVTSGARAWDGAADDAIAAEVVADLRAFLPALRDVRVTRTHVVRERHATLSLTPAAERARPLAETSIANLFLAGDWVQTGLPATIESAVVSGRRAAACALATATPRAQAPLRASA